MCLYVKRGYTPETATKDILCYKLVEDHVRYWNPFVFHEEFSYPYNKVLTAESYGKGEICPIQHLEVKDIMNLYGKMVEEGFHASCIKTRPYTHPCIIPKGTEYCLGENDEIVAVNMIVFRSTLDYYWYRIKKLLKS
jgi:hypothetical protein